VKRSRHLAFFGPLDLAATHWDQRSSVYTARETSTRTSSLYTAREQITADDVLDEESFYRAYSGTVATYSAVELSILDAILPLARAGILHAEWPPREEFLAACPRFEIFSHVGSNTTMLTEDIETSKVADL
jgi:hypothetical protein